MKTSLTILNISGLRYWCFFVLTCIHISVYAEGTKELAPLSTDPSTINTWSTVSNTEFAGYDVSVEWRLYISIENFALERINMGFRKLNSSDVIYYRIKDPTGTVVFGPKVIPTAGVGYIANHGQAVIGPVTIGGAGGYTEDTYDPLMNGDYYIEFNRDNSTTQVQNEINIDLWDITVSDKVLSTAIPGRIHSQSWAFNGGSYTAGFWGKFYIYTSDSVVTRLDVNGMQPYRFVLNCNDYGVQNTGDFVEDRKSITSFVLAPQYKIFLNDPDSTIYPTAIQKAKVAPTTPTVINCGDATCLNVNFTKGGQAQIVVDLDGTPGYNAGTEDLRFIETVGPGIHCFPWDGRDGLGNKIPAGTNLDIISTVVTGLTNFPIWDAECNPNGFIVDAIRPTTPTQPRLYYDDTNLGGADMTSAGCVAPCHQWATTGPCGSSSIGDKKMINTYWFSQLDSRTYTVNVQACAPDAQDDSSNTTLITPVVIDVLFNDTDINNDIDSSSVSVPGALQPTNGSITSINPTTGQITYTADPNFIGTDTFYYVVCDDIPLCDTAMVVVVVTCDAHPSRNKMSGSVFYDYFPSNQVYDPTDAPIQNTKVILFEDVNQDGLIDAGDQRLDSVLTDANGDYNFLVDSLYWLTTGNYNQQISSATDDAHEKSDDQVEYDKNEHELGKVIVAIRWTNINIPQGAIIASSYIELYSKDNDSDIMTTEITAEDIDDAPAIVETDFNISSRTATTNSLSWNISSNWSSDVFYPTPDLSNIVQEVVDRPGWSSGNDMLFMFDIAADDRKIRTYDNDPSEAPRLVINYYIETTNTVYFLMKTDTNTLPTGNYSLTTDNIESAIFSDLGNADCFNNFGYFNSTGFWPLALDIFGFDASCYDSYINLKWNSNIQDENEYFVIERSLDGSEFEAIGSVSSPVEETSSKLFNFRDDDPVVGTNFYRLKQTDIDGNIDYSSVISEFFKVPLAISKIKVYPTLLKKEDQRVLIVNPSTEDMGIDLTIINSQSRQIHYESIDLLSDSQYKLSDLHLSKGIYFLKIIYKDEVKTYKILVTY
ncbi:MAG: hypothetical protein HKN92_01700 [Chitinophagales bacterium]|nr:hypothetical protein [Chitinophagales bacterium]